MMDNAEDGVVTTVESEATTGTDTKKRELQLIATWNKTKYTLQVHESETVSDVKDALEALTQVPRKRQKIIGLVKGSMPDDNASLCKLPLKLKPNSSVVEFMMMGTRDESLFKDPDHVALPDVINDLDYDYVPEKKSYLNEAEVQKKLKETAAKTEINIINPLRDGKKLLVLDLDYTLFDCKSPAGHISELMRPGMHAFLTSVYEYYDIVIWSQTNWRHLEAKVTELGILNHDDYKIAFVLDIKAMFSIVTRKSDGFEFKHQVKALDIIWNKFPGRFHERNTIHIDDLGRNFALNPSSGLKITPFKNARVSRLTDRELYFLARYLTLISTLESFSSLQHKYWKRYPGVLED